VKIKVLQIGKTNDEYLLKGIDEYSLRIKNYVPFEIETIPYLKNSNSFSTELVKQKEGELILQKIKKEDILILLDENGKTYSSKGFATFLQQQMNAGNKQLIFLIGGAYGFSSDVYERSNGKLSLSSMTFSHQIIRIIFIEQLYRGFTIIHHHPYHHE
jgi:23S rRNA (pseudouridine1915-N3)-methyltransferase